MSSDLNVDPDDDIFYIFGVGMFKEALFVLKRRSKASYSKSSRSDAEYERVRRVYTFPRGEGNRVLAVNPMQKQSENGRRYSIIHCRALNKVFRIKYDSKSHDSRIEEWKLKSDFPDIQCIASYPNLDNFCFALTVEYGADRRRVDAVLYGLCTLQKDRNINPVQLVRFEMTPSTTSQSNSEQQHHCRTMCWMQSFNALCVVVEGLCYLVFPDDQNGAVLQSKEYWNLYKVGSMLVGDRGGHQRMFYPNSIAQYKDTQFIVAVDGTKCAKMFEVVS